MNIALGFRAHSGWATLVAVSGKRRSPVVVDRRQIQLSAPTIHGSKQPYHAAQMLQLDEAEKFVNRCIEDATRRAEQALRTAIDCLCQKGDSVVGCGILLGSGRPMVSLATTLASHALVHTAEGELFRKALVHASERYELPVTGVKERELFDRGAVDLHYPVDELKRHVAELGRVIGPPWRQDEKLAALAGWVALAAASKP